jgi:hypothetical protein
MSNTIRDGVRYFGCCLCDDVFEGYGNNPDPVKNIDGEYFDDEEECCDNCNSMRVIPARMKEMGL